ncbi:LptF/LptG family permease, partial [Desulfovibrio sp. OttesenSCG-928-I05]|nr:LptF/LptG family permease [Desulfovibrio sp. OttesenSCG-928-I05]
MLKLFPGKLVESYIARDLVRTFVLCMVSLLTLILISRGIHFRDLFFGLEVSFRDILYLFACLTPAFMLIVLPLSCMLSVFLTFLRMSTDRELIALKAGGVSIYQLMRAPVLFAALCMGLNVLVSLYGISWGMNQFRSTVLEIANERAQVVIQPGVFNQDIFGITLFARKVDPASGEMSQVIFEDRTRDKKNRITVLAPRGTITTDRRTGSLVFMLHDGEIYRADGQQFGILSFREYAIRVDLSTLFKEVDLGEIRPKDMSWQELRTLYTQGTSEALDARNFARVEVELQKRWALPAACIVLC